MKIKLLLLLPFFLWFSSCSSDRDVVASDVPPTVLAAFNAKYPDAKDVEWEMEREGENIIWEAEFRHDGLKKEERFKPDGTIIGSE